MITARQSTARTVIVGPVLDANGAAVTTSVLAAFKISKNGGAPAALNASATLTHRHTGHYSLALTATDLDTVGQAEVTLDDTVNATQVKEITVVSQAVYDALYASTAAGYGTVTLAAVTHTGAVIPTVTNLTNLPAIPAGWLTAAGIAADAFTAAKFAPDVTTELQAGLATSAGLAAVQADTDNIQTRLPAALVGGKMDSVAAVTLGTDSITAAVLSADAVAEIQAGLATASGLATVQAKTDLLTPEVATWALRGLTMIELDGAVYRYTANALELAPVAGAASNSGFWTYSTSTTMADPGNGKVRFNAALSIATSIALDVLTSGGTDASSVLAQLASGDTLHVQDQANSSIWTDYTLAAAPVNQGGGWWQLAVTPGLSLGAPGNNDTQILTFAKAGAGGGVMVVGYSPGMDPATQVLGAQTSDWTDPGTVGEKIASLPSDWTAVEVTLVSPVTQSGDIELYVGDSYQAADGRALQWTGSSWPDLAGGTIEFAVHGTAGPYVATLTAPGTAADLGGGEQLVQVELSALDTVGLVRGTYEYELVATLASTGIVTLVRGKCVVKGE